MSNEVANVEILKEAYRQWHETKGNSVYQFFAFFDRKHFVRFDSTWRCAA